MERDLDFTLALATELVELRPGSLLETDYSQLERLVLDHCGVAVNGSERPWVQALHQWAVPYKSTGSARIIAGNLSVSAEVAGFVNGAAGHSFELDDTHDSSLSHPGAVVIPAALATASATSAQGKEIFAAIAAGYEAIARIGIAARAGDVIASGYHPTALFGGFGAATAAGKLMGFSPQQVAQSWGHVLSTCSGSMQFSQEESGADVKRIHAGLAARNGILAAQLTQAGISAPLRALDGKYGFLALYGHDPDPNLLTTSSARRWAIHDISLKPYACCRLLHSMIDALRIVTNSFSAKYSDVRGIVVRGPSKLAEQHMILRPKTPMAAQYSLPYTVGATMAYGPDRFDAYDNDKLSDPEILQWMSRVSIEKDADLQATYPQHFGTEVEVEFSDGRKRSERVLDSIGTPVNAMSRSVVEAKARALAEGRLGNAGFENLLDAVYGLRTADSIEALQRAYTFP